MSELLVQLEWFKAVILPHEAAVRRRLTRICPPGFDIENLVAESLARAFQAKDIARITAGRSYLFSIARNILIDAMRREAVVSLDFMADLDSLRIDDGLERSLQARDQLRQLQAIIETLPAQCRRAFLLKRVHDYSLAQIAEEMGLSVSTVEKHLAKAVRLVAKALAEREDDGVGFISGRSDLPGGARRPGLGARGPARLRR